MRWQEKVKRWIESQGTTPRKLAKRIDVSENTLRTALDGKDAWSTVTRAIRLAREMGTTVEYLFDPATDWPEPKQPMPFGMTPLQREAIATLERIAAGIPPESNGTPKTPAKKIGRQR